VSDAIKLVLTILRFIASHPIQTALYIVFAACASVIIWAFATTSKSKNTIIQQSPASLSFSTGTVKVEVKPAPGSAAAVQI
jgi:hypothetical protein